MEWRVFDPPDDLLYWIPPPPMRIMLRSGEPFGFAGLWETWKNPEAELVRSCTIITTVPNPLMEPIHNRMPVMLTREAEEQWLDHGNTDTGELRELLVPYSVGGMEAYEVANLINKPQNDVAEVVARVD